jgi:hypothetical protein
MFKPSQVRPARGAAEVQINPATGKRYTKAELVSKILTGRTEGTLIVRQYMRMTAGELQKKLNDKESFRYTQRVATGSVHTHGTQADIYGGQFKVVSFDAKTNAYIAEILPPSAEVIGRILADVEAGTYYVGPGQDRWEEAEKEIQRREERAGDTFRVKFVSSAAYAEAF